MYLAISAVSIRSWHCTSKSRCHKAVPVTQGTDSIACVWQAWYCRAGKPVTEVTGLSWRHPITLQTYYSLKQRQLMRQRESHKVCILLQMENDSAKRMQQNFFYKEDHGSKMSAREARHGSKECINLHGRCNFLKAVPEWSRPLAQPGVGSGLALQDGPPCQAT